MNSNVAKFLPQFMGNLTSDFISFSGEDVVFFKCKRIPNTFRMKFFDDYLKSTNRSILFTALEFNKYSSLIAVGFKSTKYLQETIIDLLVFLSKQRIFATVYHSTKSAAELLRMLKCLEPMTEDQNGNDQTEPGLNDSNEDDFLLFSINPLSSIQAQKAEQAKFDSSFSYQQLGHDYSWKNHIYDYRVPQTDMEKKLSMFNDVTLIEEPSTYQLLKFQNQRLLMNLPKLSNIALQEISGHISYFETED